MARHSRWRRQRLLIVGYHGISLEDEHQWNPALYVSPSAFKQRLELLRRGRYSVLTLSAAISRLYAKDLPESSVVLTFDDGTYDFYKQVFPLLKSYDFPATVYLSTYYCDFNKPVFDGACSYILWKSRGSVIRPGGLLGDADVVLDLTTPSGRKGALGAIQSFVKTAGLSAEEKNAFARRLADLLNFDYDAFLRKRMLHLVSPREVAELSSAGIDIQLHTHRHRAPLDRNLFAREIEENRASILRMTGSSPSHFCYPNNLHRPEFLGWLAELGVVSAATSDPGLASAQSNVLLLPRIIDNAYSAGIELESWLAGIGRWLPRRPQGQASA